MRLFFGGGGWGSLACDRRYLLLVIFSQAVMGMRGPQPNPESTRTARGNTSHRPPKSATLLPQWALNDSRLIYRRLKHLGDNYYRTIKQLAKDKKPPKPAQLDAMLKCYERAMQIAHRLRALDETAPVVDQLQAHLATRPPPKRVQPPPDELSA